MSRQLLQVTLRFPEGKILEGTGRNLPATVERVYNKAFGQQRGRHAVILEAFRTGHAEEAEHRYEGTFRGGIMEADGQMPSREAFTVQSRFATKAK